MGEAAYTELTFEELTMIMRKERTLGSLSEVRRDLYPAMVRLLDKQNRECERQIGIDIGSLAAAAANERRKKIFSYIKLIVEHRMNKVAALALRTAMGCVNSTEALPPEEKQYYDSILEASKIHWSNIEGKKRNVVVPDIDRIGEPEPVTEAVHEIDIVPKKVEAVVAETLSDMPIMPDDPSEMAAEPDMSEDFDIIDDGGDIIPIGDADVMPAPVDTSSVLEPTIVTEVPPECTEEATSESVPDDETPYGPANPFDDNSMLTIRVTEDIPEFVGPTRDYRLRKSDVIRMPAGMAMVLINRKMAVKLL
ncbi:MAG: hypothetical protein ACI4Q9_02725 [Candidatus Methanomethylophilaceae archaeon]